MRRIYNGFCSSSEGHVKNAEKEEWLSRWQQQLERAARDRCTFRFIPTIKVYTHDKINYDIM